MLVQAYEAGQASKPDPDKVYERGNARAHLKARHEKRATFGQSKINEKERLSMHDEHAPFERSLAKKIIRRQMNRSGNILLSAIEPMSDEQFFGAGLNGVSAAWMLGHLACVTDLYGSWVRKSIPSLDVEVHKIFNGLDIGAKEGTKTKFIDSQAFSKKDIVHFFRQAHVEALATLDTFDESLWESAPPDYVPDSLPTYGAIWETMGVHIYWHLGELCGAHPQFHGTYTLNAVLHYFYVPPGVQTTQEDGDHTE